MSDTDALLRNSEENKAVEKKPHDCNARAISGGFFKLNGWKTTLIIVLVSLCLRQFLNSKTPRQRADGFLQLVPDAYEDAELVEWEPAPAPVSKPGELGNLGQPVVIPEHLQNEAKERFNENQFCIIANELMSMNRTMPDIRYPECSNVQYPRKLPQVSVVIVYHNEAWSTLIRTVWSVITQSPRTLIKEIILVDDFSNKEHLGRPLQEYVPNFPVPVLLARTLSRVGLIQARLLGSSKATSKVLVFLDAHCECVQGWLEALIAPIAERRSNVAVPIIDVIDHTTMEVYTAENNIRGSFDLSLLFTWDPIPDRVLDSLNNDRTAAIESPAMAGGLFAIDREYFYALGSYDENMKIWGGENIEMSVRVWTCGGRLIMVPCSRVGHIFRDETPYVVPGGSAHVISHNSARMAEVWLDDYKNIFYAINPRAKRERTIVTERLLLRQKLQCKPFKWYLENIFPESLYNINNYTMVEIESIDKENICLDSMGESLINGRNVEAKLCHHQGEDQVFMFTETNEIRGEKFCLDATIPGETVKMIMCHGEGGNQYWKYDENTNLIGHKDGQNCLTILDESNIVTIAKCDGSIQQQWLLAPPSSERDFF